MAKTNRNNKTGRVIAVILVSILIVCGLYYVTLPAMNIHSGGFWTFFFVVDALIFVDWMILHPSSMNSVHVTITEKDGKIIKSSNGSIGKFVGWQVGITAVIILLLIIGSFFSSQIFHAKTYSSLINVEEGSFAEDIEETERVTDIALMDSASARIIGARTLGTLSDLVSQYEIAYDYTQIAIEGTPYKVAPLEYASFFKWLRNSSSGIPGYVKVDPVNFSAEFIRLEGSEYIQYSDSAYFSKNLTRALRFAYPTAIFGTSYFEVDNEGHPYWIQPIMEPQSFIFGAFDVSAVVVLDAVTGETAKYEPENAPEWIDIIYTGNLVCQKYDWYGMLRNGYLNSVFGQSNCVKTTDDFGYKIIGDDVYIFTGVTSVANDEANIGFILVNSRTGEYKYYSVAGAEEYSAMAAAEGSVQQYGYNASFPSLVNIGGEATYIMVLKDASGIVKMYSMVNVRNYNIVSTSTTQAECQANYISLLGSNYVVDESTLTTETVTVEEILYIPTNGNTTVYIRSDKGVFSMDFDEKILLVNVGDEIEVKYSTKGDITRIVDVK